MDNTHYKLYRIFLRYCGPNNDVTEKNFVKLCKDYGILDGVHVTITDAEMAFQIKVNTGYNMEYDEFKETVGSLAKLGSHTADEMFEKMISMPPPPVEKQVKRKVSREATGSSTSDVTKEEKANTYRRSSSSKAVRRNSSGTKTENMKTKDLKSSSSGSLPQRIHKRAMNIVSRLTNPSTYTGTQKERFEKIEKEKQAKPPEPEKDQSLLDFLRERRSSLAMPAENKKVLDLDSFLQQMLGTDPAEASTSSGVTRSSAVGDDKKPKQPVETEEAKQWRKKHGLTRRASKSLDALTDPQKYTAAHKFRLEELAAKRASDKESKKKDDFKWQV